MLIHEHKMFINNEVFFADAQGDIVLRLLPVVLPAPVQQIGWKAFRSSYKETRKSFADLQPVH